MIRCILFLFHSSSCMFVCISLYNLVHYVRPSCIMRHILFMYGICGDLFSKEERANYLRSENGARPMCNHTMFSLGTAKVY